MPKHAIALGALLALTGGPALANLTPAQVWQDWQRVYAALGGDATATETAQGDTLQLTDLTLTMTVADLDSVTDYGDVTLTGLPDGSVRIGLPPTLTATTSVTTPGGETVTQTLTIATTDLDAVVREGADGARIYAISAEALSYAADDLSGGEGEVPVSLRMVLTGLVAAYTNREDAGTLSTDQTLTADDLTISVASLPAEGPFSMDYALDSVSSQAAGTVDLTAATAQADEGRRSLTDLGVLFSGEATHSGSTTQLSFVTPNGPASVDGTSGGGTVGFDLSADALGYTLSSTNARLAVQTATFPVPLNLTMTEVGMGIALPVGKPGAAKPYALALALREVAVDDALWSLFDPTGQLPRDPATLLLDLSGTARTKVDLFGGDPEAMARLQGPPADLETLDLTQLRIALAGALLTGNGALTFPGGGPVPQPEGSVTLALEGGLALLDRLVALGFVPAPQAAFVKGMAGVVARTDGPDSLSSEVVFSQGGGITANGVPLR